MTHPSVDLQIVSTSVPSVPCWFGEVAIVARLLTASEVLQAIEQRVRFARPRFGIYEVMDFFAVLIGYAISGEPTLQAFYERLFPFAAPFMALFGRQALPHRSTLSRFLAALDQPAVEALRLLFEEDLVLRTAQTFPPGGLWDRMGQQWQVMDVDATRQAARQRALPGLAELPAPHRRFDRVCAPAYLGRKRGEVARTRTTILQAHTHHWLGTFGGPGNGDYQAELLRASEAIIRYAGWLYVPLSQILVRLDGLYGNGAVVGAFLASGLGIIVRCKDYGMLDLPAVAARLSQPPDHHTTHPESGAQRALFDCPDITLSPSQTRVRLIVATHPTISTAKPPIGVLRAGTVYELFLTTAPQTAFTAADVLDLYLHRGSFETVLWDEDVEQDSDRWCSRTACGQECWQMVNQWVWNMRLHLGQHLEPTPMRLTTFAQALESVEEPPSVQPSEPAEEPLPAQPPEPILYGPPQWARRSWTSGFAGADFVVQPDGTLQCPASHPLRVHERRPERNGSVRIVYGARITHCRPCALRSFCLESVTTRKPRQVSAVIWPVQASASIAPHPALPCDEASSTPLHPPSLVPQPVLWGDWPRCRLRRRWLHLLRTQTVTIGALAPVEHTSLSDAPISTRAERAHYRLSWQQRLARNARSPLAPAPTMTIYGLPAPFAQSVGLPLAPIA